MAPVWQEIRQALQVYAEPYFTALERWRQYKSHELIENRLQMLETVCSLFTQFASDQSSYTFQVVSLSSNKMCDDLFEEVIPTFGRELVAEGDRKVYELLRSTIPWLQFKLGGLYFQEQLLFLIAGVNKRTLTASNVQNRRAILEVLSTVLRIPERFAVVRISGQLVTPPNEKTMPVFFLPTEQIKSTYGRRLLEYLTKQETKNDTPVPGDIFTHAGDTRGHKPLSLKRPLEPNTTNQAHSSNQSHDSGHVSGRRNTSAADQSSESSDSNHSPPTIQVKRSRTSAPPPAPTVPSAYNLVPRIKWNTEHYSVGMRVATLRTTLSTNAPDALNAIVNNMLCSSPWSDSTCSIPPGAIELRGTVIAHAIRSEEPHEHVHRIQWADRRLEIEIYTASQLQTAVALLDRLDGWVNMHPMIGRRVAGVFYTSRPITQTVANTPYHAFTTKHSCTASVTLQNKAEGANAPLSGTPALLSPVLRQAHVPHMSSEVQMPRPKGVDRVQLGRNKVLYAGVVTKYLPASRAGGRSAQDQLYHIEWCDGDREDLEERELREALDLYAQHRTEFEAR